MKLSINGDGFYVLSDRGGLLYTRSQTFSLSGSYIVLSTYTGIYLQGYPADQQGQIAVGVLGDISVGDADIATVTIDATGIVSGEVDGERLILGQIVLATFDTPFFLRDLSNGLLSRSSSSGLSVISTPGSGNHGLLNIGELELEAPDYTVDWSITGDGYFVFDKDGNTFYASSSRLISDKNGFLASIEDYEVYESGLTSGYYLRGYLADNTGNITSTTGRLHIDTSNQPPSATTMVTLNINLDSREATPINAFNHEDDASYNAKSEMVIYDS